MASYRRIYDSYLKKAMIAGGVTIPLAAFLIFSLAASGHITILAYSGDLKCAGTVEEPCTAWVQFKANKDIFY